jgi:SAM-dependent methyltransferase
LSRLNLGTEFWEYCSGEIGKASVLLDLGGGKPWSGPVKRESTDLNALYVSMDFEAGKKPHVAGDVTSLPFSDSSADVVVSCAVLEHLPSPQEAVDEMLRVLRPGGSVLGYVPFVYPWHASPSDFHRFSGNALEHLFRDYSGILIVPCGNYSTVALGFMTGFSFPLMRLFGPLADITGRAASFLVSGMGSRKHVAESYSRTVLGHFFRAVR